MNMKKLMALACAALAIFSAGTAMAANLYSSGSKTWNTSTANWGPTSGSYSGSTWNNATPDSAFLEGTAGTVTLGEPINIANLTLSTANYVITNNTLSFASGGTIGGTGSGVKIYSGISGSPSLNQSNMNNLQLTPTAANMILGTITRSGDNYFYIGGTTTGNSITLIPKGHNNAKLYWNGSGTWTVGNIYGGEMYIQNGNLVVNGELTADFNGIFLDGGVLHYNNAGAVKGPTTGSALKFNIRGGSIDNSSSAAITTSTWNPQQSWGGNWTFIGSGGASSDLFLGNGAVTLTGTRQVTVQNAATTLTIGGGVTDAAKGYGVTKAGLGKLVLRGSHSYSGKTMVSAGTLSLGNGTTNSLSDVAVLEIATGATLNANWSAANVDTVFMLTFDGTPQAAGTWGATDSGADHEDARITGTGIINNFGGLYTDGSFFWDGPTAGGTGDGVSNGGAGTWSAANANWDNGFTARVGWTDSTANKAIFGGAAGTVTLGSAITLGELIFSSTAASGYKIQGQTLNFGGAKKITVASTGATIESGITGSPDVDQPFSVNLNLKPTSANMSLNTIIRNGDSYLYLQGTTTGNTLGSISKGVSGVNAANAKLNFDGTGKWTLLGNVYAGEMYIQSGEVVANGELSADFRGVYVQNTGVLHYNNPGAVKGPSDGSSATLRFYIQGGSIDNSSGAAITTSTWNPKQEWGGNWTFIGSQGTNSDLYLGNGPVGLTGTRQVTVQNAATTLTVGGVISGATFGLTKSGTGALKLTGKNTYSGATTISNGTLQVVTGGSCSNSAVTVTNTTGITSALAVVVTNSALPWVCSNLTVSAVSGGAAQLKFVFGVTPSQSQAPLVIRNTVAFNDQATLVVGPANLASGKKYPLITVGGIPPLTVPTLSITGMSGILAWEGNTLYLTIPPAGTLINIF